MPPGPKPRNGIGLPAKARNFRRPGLWAAHALCAPNLPYRMRPAPATPATFRNSRLLAMTCLLRLRTVAVKLAARQQDCRDQEHERRWLASPVGSVYWPPECKVDTAPKPLSRKASTGPHGNSYCLASTT